MAHFAICTATEAIPFHTNKCGRQESAANDFARATKIWRERKQFSFSTSNVAVATTGSSLTDISVILSIPHRALIPCRSVYTANSSPQFERFFFSFWSSRPRVIPGHVWSSAHRRAWIRWVSPSGVDNVAAAWTRSFFFYISPPGDINDIYWLTAVPTSIFMIYSQYCV